MAVDPSVESGAWTDKLGANPAGFLDNLFNGVIKGSEGANVVISPICVLGPISYLLPATKTTTRAAMSTALFGDDTKLSDEAAMGVAQGVYNLGSTLHDLIHTSSEGSATFNMATRVIVKNGHSLSGEMKKALQDSLVDIDPNDGDAAAKSVNGWIGEQTEGKITELMTPGDFGPLFRLAVISAVYFNGKFTIPFDKKKTTKDAPFFASREDAKNGFSAKPVCKCAMMNASGVQYPHCSTANFTCVRLDYIKDKLGLVLALPNSDGVESMTRKELFGLKFNPKKISLSVPKFKFEFEIQLNDILKALGMAELFDDSKCDLSGLLESDDPLSVTVVKHRAMIEVDEKGTTASAAAAAVVKTRGRPASVKSVKFNSKFDFFIVDYSMSLVLFSGTVTKP